MPAEGLLGQIKRFVVGEPIPSHLAHHERLSRVTGLAVLSSDPLSSVAYATEEILRVLILVNVSALAFASPIAAHHRAPFSRSSSSRTARRYMRIRAAAARTSSRAKISASSQPRRRVRPADRLHPHRCRQHRCWRRRADVGVSRSGSIIRVDAGAGVSGGPDAGQSSRNSRIGADICGADLLLHCQPARDLIAVGAWRSLTGDRSTGRADRTDGVARSAAHAVPPAQGVLERMHGNDGCGGRVQRRSRLQTARGAERGRHHGDHGRAGDHDVRRHHAAGAALRHHSERARNGRLAARARRVRGARSPLLPGPGGDDADPRAGGQYRICRLSSTRVDSGARSLSAPSIHEPGGQARIFERHSRPQRASLPCCSSCFAATRTR